MFDFSFPCFVKLFLFAMWHIRLAMFALHAMRMSSLCFCWAVSWVCLLCNICISNFILFPVMFSFVNSNICLICHCDGASSVACFLERNECGCWWSFLFEKRVCWIVSSIFRNVSIVTNCFFYVYIDWNGLWQGTAFEGNVSWGFIGSSMSFFHTGLWRHGWEKMSQSKWLQTSNSDEIETFGCV